VRLHAYSMVPPGRQGPPLSLCSPDHPCGRAEEQGILALDLKRHGGEGLQLPLISRPCRRQAAALARRACGGRRWALWTGELSLEDCRSGVAAAASPFHLASEFQLSSSSKHM
jgi:hypothetical protein